MPALAQTQSLVVPPGSTVVIAPRGQPSARPTMAPPTRSQQRIVMVSPSGDTLTGPTAAAAIGLAGAAAIAVILGGGGGGGGGSGGGGGAAAAGAPARTR
jgi:hypothetical protein